MKAGDSDSKYMAVALRLAARAYGDTSPNPLVGALLVKKNEVIGRGWHRRAGEAHAEIEAFQDAERHGKNVRGATLYVTLEPCSSQGRTPPCTDAIVAREIKRVVVAATDPNPKHAGRGFELLRRAGIEVVSGVLEAEATRLNEAFNHWIVHRTPFVTVKAAMSLDGKIATRNGESKWITGPQARAYGMHLRRGSDAILVGVNTVLADDPALSVRSAQPEKPGGNPPRQPRRIILDSEARTPPRAKVVSDEQRARTTLVVTRTAPKERVDRLRKQATVWVAPEKRGGIDLRWVLAKLGAEEVTQLLVEGGGEVNASFLFGGFAHRVAFFYAPKVIGGRDARKAVGGRGVTKLDEFVRLTEVEWKQVGEDLLLVARVGMT